MRFERWLYVLPLRLRSLFRETAVERELDEELHYHLERQIELNVERGMTREDARHAASRAMGGMEQHKEACRDRRKVQIVDHLIRDARYGLRLLRRSPVFAAVAILSLALGIGANAAIFQLIDMVSLRSLPIANPQELAEVRADGVYAFGAHHDGFHLGSHFSVVGADSSPPECVLRDVCLGKRRTPRGPRRRGTCWRAGSGSAETFSRRSASHPSAAGCLRPTTIAADAAPERRL